MEKLDLTFERILGTFVPGALFLFAAWYLHRPFLIRYFPHVAGDPAISSSAGFGVEMKTVLFIIASFCMGLIFNFFSDVVVSCQFKDDAMSEESIRKTRRIARFCWRPFCFTYNESDFRMRSVARYLRSPRKARFLRMMSEWAGTNEENLSQSKEAIIAYQHVMFRMRVLSEHSRKLLQEAEFNVTFSASILIAFASLVPVALLSFVTSSTVDNRLRVHYDPTLVMLAGVIYLGAVISNYSLKRQFRHFCYYVLTLALHCYEASGRPAEVESAAPKPVAPPRRGRLGEAH